MKYFADFYSIDAKPYRIEIDTPSGSGSRELKLSGTPFTSSVKADDKHLYSPIRCGGATVGLLSKECIFDLYSGQAQGVKVRLLSGVNAEKVEWTGYVSPTMYDQGFDDEWEEIELDCVDGIAVLKDVPFRVPERTIMTFLELIFYCLKASGCYRNFYISDNVQLTAGGTESVIEKFRVSSSNFFDERKDMAQTDDDVAWSCYDVLYEICQWLGYTVISEGDEVFIIDYDAIRNGRNSYFLYSLEGESPSQSKRVTVAYNKAIQGADYAGNGSKVSLDEIFNKVTVKDEFHTYDNLFPAFGDENYETNITCPKFGLSTFYQEVRSKGLQFGDHIAASPADGIYEDFCIIIDRDFAGNYWLNIFKFMETPVFDMIKYNRNTRQQVTLNSDIKYSDLLTLNGAFYYRWLKQTVTSRGQFLDEANISMWIRRQREEYDPNWPTAQKIKVWGELFEQINIVDKLTLSPVIVMMNAGLNRFGPADEINYNGVTDNEITKQYPFIKLKNYDSAIFGGANHFLRIKGNFSFHDEDLTPHKLNNGANNSLLRYHGDYKHNDQGFIWCKIKWGDQWWGGDTIGWVNEDTWFRLYFWLPSDCGYANGHGMWNEDNFDKDFKFKNLNYTLYNLGEDGYCIPCPSGGNLNGKAEISFATRDMEGTSKKNNWKPSGSKFDNYYSRYFSNCVFITDLSITTEIYEGLFEDADLDSDTLYTNVIENGSISEMNVISFKVCTDDGKKPSYSSVDTFSADTSQFVSTTYNRALQNKERGTMGTDGLDACLRQEEHFVFKLATQYQDPRLIYECNLHNEGLKLYGTYTDPTFGSRVFVISERSIDYRFNSVELKLTEKA